MAGGRRTRKGKHRSRPVGAASIAPEFCPNCSGAVSQLDRFCPACGTLLPGGEEE